MTLGDFVAAWSVAAVVLMLPGYFWGLLLFPAAGRAERATVALALSLALVPTTGRLLSWIFQTGLTLPVALASVTVPTVSGLMFYWRFRSPSVQATRLHHEVLSVPDVALIPLGVGAALMVLPVLTRTPESLVAIPIVLLIMLAALFYLVHSRGRDCPDGSFARDRGSERADPRAYSRRAPDAGEPKGKAGRWRWARLRVPQMHGLALPIVLLLVLIRGYLGPVQHDWPFIRGADQYVHAIMTDLVLEQGSAENYLIYPPGFHQLSAVLSRLSGLSPLDLYPAIAPALLLLPALSCYVLARRLFGLEYGLLACLFAGLILPSPLRFLGDGTYVDIIAGEFLLVLTVVSLVLLLTSPSPRHILLLGIIGSSVVLYHTISTLYLALLLALVAVVVLPVVLYRDRRRGMVLLIGLSLLAVMSVTQAWDTYNLGETVPSLLGWGGSTEASRYATTIIGTQPPLRLLTLPAYLSYPVVCFGLLGMFVLLARLTSTHWLDATAIALLLGWTCIFFGASRTSLSAFPWRFTRDLGLPLSVLAALGTLTVLRTLKRRGVVPIVVSSLLVLVVLLQARQSLAMGAGPSRLLLPTRDIQAAGAWLRAHNDGGNIIVSAHMDQAPANAMLAMGGYHALSSFPFQVGSSRQIPPQHHQAVKDSQEVLKRPGGSAARDRILSAQEIRYVVLYKRLRPGSVWFGKNPIDPATFQARERLYQVVFENDEVVIFQVLKQAERG